MTLIIDMASGTSCEETPVSRSTGEPVADHRLVMPAAEPGLARETTTRTAATIAMPAFLQGCDIARFLDSMD
jgi:hypothetical protein